MSEPLGPGGTRKPPPTGDHEPAPKPRRYWWRFTLASFLIVVVSAAATATAVLLYIDSVANAIGPENEKVESELEKILKETHGGEPQTFLFLGSDKRANEAEDPGRSDTTMLLRLDPEKNLISMMSIPRDLKVEIPEYGTGKFNEAYSYGGAKLTLKVVKELTGLPVNHVVNIDFLGFAQAVYAIGCVFTDVDRRYYHSNEGLSPSEQYAEINVEPGYQLLCGKKALEYVRYRHTDTDIVRSARQQDFLSSVRQRISPKDLVFDQDELIEVFGKYTTSDITGGRELIEVAKLMVELRNAEVKEVHFPAELGPSYVYSTPEAIGEAVEEFLGIEGGGEGGARDELAASSEKKDKQGKKGKKNGGKRKKHKQPKPEVETPKRGDDGLVPAREAGEAEAKIAARRAKTPFAIFYPTRLPEGAFYIESDPYEKIVDPYVYRIKEAAEKGAAKHLAYRMMLVLEKDDGTHYFGVQGIRGWADPPILDDPSLTKEINGRDYDVYVDSGRVSMVAWHRGENSYWISNDLLQTLTNDQMVGMARSAAVLVPKKKPKRGRSR